VNIFKKGLKNFRKIQISILILVIGRFFGGGAGGSEAHPEKKASWNNLVWFWELQEPQEIQGLIIEKLVEGKIE